VSAALAAGAQPVTLPAGHPSPPPAVPASLDVSVAVPVDQRSAFAALQDVLDAADRLAAEDLLLVRPALPEIVALRDWCCEQVVAQLSGVPGTPWPGTAQERFAGDRRLVRARPVWDDALLLSTSRAVVAADDFNRIIGISEAAADLLGWTADELVGRRVVAIIPPELREAHVAGFTRHLTTGVAHALGVELDLPVLRRDGTTVLCRFLVESAPASAGRAVYLAYLRVL
jgi:PAS domain S-box-containing protein